MIMRVTQGMATNNLLRDISNGYGKVVDYQQQLASGKKISRPSQDPVVASMGIVYRTDVAHVEQYQRNVSTANKWLEASDDALSQASDVLTRIRELTEQASNGTYTEAQRSDMAQEVGELEEHLKTLANTQVGGQYIFSGSDTDNPLVNSTNPVDINTIATDPDATKRMVQFDVSDGIKVSVNVDPGTVFTQDMFDQLNNLKTALTDGSSGTEISGYLTNIDQQLDTISNAQADLGAKTNRIELISDRLDEQKNAATKIMSTNEDADYAETLVNLNQQQNVYNASLFVGARIIQTSLVDFLQ